MSHYYDQWSLITNNPVVLSCIEGYKIPFTSPVSQSNIPPTKEYSHAEKCNFHEAITNLLSIGAISKCDYTKGQFLSSVFLVPKPNGKFRFILNLKNLNKFITADHFKIEDLRTVLKLITKNCYMSKIDLKDAYYLIKIHPDSRKFLRFQFEQELYEFNVLPFGLSTAPYIFTKIMKPIIRLLRMAGLVSTNYLDDYWLMGQSYEDCLRNTSLTKMLITSLGFKINEEKSSLVPNTTCTFLGFVLNSENFQIILPSEKILRVRKEIEIFLSLKRCKIREFARFIGLLVSVCPALEYSWLYTKLFERTKYINLLDDENYDKYMFLPPELKPDLQCHSKTILQNQRRYI